MQGRQAEAGVAAQAPQEAAREGRIRSSRWVSTPSTTTGTW
jgi:hypothetical protein